MTEGREVRELRERIAGKLANWEAGAEKEAWENLDEETKDLFSLLMADRLSYFSKIRAKEDPKRVQEEQRQFHEWKERITNKYPGIETDGEAFLDWVVACQGKEVEDTYLFGVKEGIRIMRMVYSF